MCFCLQHKKDLIINIISCFTVFSGVLFVHQPGENYAPGAPVTQVNHSVYTLSTFVIIIIIIIIVIIIIIIIIIYKKQRELIIRRMLAFIIFSPDLLLSFHNFTTHRVARNFCGL